MSLTTEQTARVIPFTSEQCDYSELARLRDRVNGGKFGGERAQARRLDRGFVHETRVQVTDLACLRSGGVAPGQ